MTELENLQHDAIVNAKDMLAAGRKLTVNEFMEVMDLLRRSIKHYENRLYGCPTGAHSGHCTCVPPKVGIRINR